MTVRSIPMALLLACAAAVLAACTASTGGSFGPGTARAPETTAGVTPAPGLTRLGGGRAVGYGWLVETDLEGGMWQVVDQPASSDVAAKVVAVLLPGKVTVEQLDRVRGTFVGAEGVLQEGVSIRMAGPELVVDALRVY